MNLITKLNILKTNTLVKKGQIIYNGENLPLENGNLCAGLYYVTSAQINNENHEGNRRRKYIHDLELTAIGCGGGNKLQKTSNTYTISVDNDSLDKHFGIGKTAKKGIIYEFLKDQFDKAGLSQNFKPNLDYDKSFTGIARTVLSKYKLKVSEDVFHDLMMEALFKTVNPKTIKMYDPKRDILTFFTSMFFNNMIIEVKKHYTYIKNIQSPSQDEDDMNTQEETLEMKRKEDLSKSPEHTLNSKELFQGLKNFMKGRTRGDRQIQVLGYFMDGYSNNEIAEKLNASPALVSRLTNDVRASILEYAKKTDNKDLLKEMDSSSKKRMHSEDETSFMVDVFKEYKKKFGSGEPKRKPAGEVLKIKKTVLEDKVSDTAIARSILSDSYASSQLKTELGEYFSFLKGQDELIEEDGNIIGLRIVSDDVRNIKQAKCNNDMKKVNSEGKGFFVYSTSCRGPHKILKTDGTFAVKLNNISPVKIYKSQVQADKAASRYLHTKLSLKVGIYPDEFERF